MIDGTIRIGDEVQINLQPEQRAFDSGHNHGKKATVVGFEEICIGLRKNQGWKPGVYAYREFAKLRLEDGEECVWHYTHLKMIDADEYVRRIEIQKKKQEGNPKKSFALEFLRDLPYTPFWEGDIVGLDRLSIKYEVDNIEYGNLNKLTHFKTKHPAYKCVTLPLVKSVLGDTYFSVNEDEITLVERGLVWKHYHNEPIVFANIREEENFFISLGHFVGVVNPSSGVNVWSNIEMVAAIRNGLAHGFSVNEDSFSARRFRDEELGKRIAEANLEELGIVIVR